MTIELECNGCRQRLRVADEHAGQLARCPQCGVTTVVPQSSLPPRLTPAAPVVEPSPYTGPADTANPYLASQVFPSGTSSNLPPHRGTMVLVFGILSLVTIPCCGLLSLVFGPIAWILGSSDLKAIRSGRMDPAGESTTQVGMILGIVATTLIGLGIAFYALMFVIAIVAGK